jgi:hypothetical protein
MDGKLMTKRRILSYLTRTAERMWLQVRDNLVRTELA